MSLEKITRGDEQTKSLDLVNDNINKLRELFPEIITEGKIDFKVLQEILGEELEEGEEYYRFTWAGKAQARREAHKPSTGTLRPCKEESVDWDTTQNLYIEGDNLEVLKLMQKSYANKVKMIYIDPPYNTGKDFVYKDNYKDNLKNYQQVTGQVDDEGNKLSTNSESDGRYHSNWLNMMYPRLRLARNLLKEDGVIFISIDDNEVDNLRKISNEVFGEDNFIANIVWQRAFSPKNDNQHISAGHDFILVYSKNINVVNCLGLPRDEKNLSRYSNPDNDERGEWQSSTMTVSNGTEDYMYEIITPSGRKLLPPDGRFWVYNKKRYQELLDDGRIWFGKEGLGVPRIKTYLSEVSQRVNPLSIWSHLDVGHSQGATQELKRLFDGKKFFDYPKPVNLIKRCIELYSSTNDLIIDFFSGSATTAQAVMQLNAEEGGTRNYIQIQLPEPIDEKSEAFKAGYKTITEIGKERIRRAGKKIAEENPDKAKDLDLGFKVFKLDSSNIKGWDGNPEDLEASLFDAQENIKTDRTEEDVLFEILLKYGLDLTLPIDEKLMDGKKVFSVGFGALFICLADDITNKVAEGIGTWKQELNPATCRVIFKDSGFSDVEKANAVQTLKRFGISEIKSI